MNQTPTPTTTTSPDRNIPDPDYCSGVCSDFVGHELSAIATYDQAIAKFDTDPLAWELKGIRSNHAISLASLRELVSSMGGDASEEPGSWAAFGIAVQSAEQLLGEKAAITTLIAGEEHGEREYRGLLADRRLTPACRELVRRELLPRSAIHLLVLRAMAATG